MTGARLGDFVLERTLGAGAMGVVWAARHRPTDVPAAVKLAFGRLSPHRRRDADREARAVAALSHPGVVRLYDQGEVPEAVAQQLGVEPGAPWLAMERAAGSLPPGACGPADLRDRLEQLLAALAHAHARGVLHLDLKPGNLLVADDGALLLGDFGIARILGDDDEPAPRRGSLPTMAPEQLRGGQLGPWTDLYAVGCLAALWVTGAWPWPDLDADAASALRSRQPVAVPGPPDLAAWVAWLTHPDPASRPPAAATAAAALRAVALPAGVGAAAGAATVATGAGPTREVVAPPAPARRRGRAAHDATSVGLLPFRRWPLAGRAEVLGALRDAAREVAEQRVSQVIGVRGPAGFGRSEVLRTLLETLHEEGAAMAVGVFGPHDRPQLVRLDAGLEPEDLVGAARRRPVVVGLDDVLERPGWCRRLPALGGRDDLPLLVVVTARPDEVGDLRGVSRWVELPPLSAPDLDGLVQSLVELAPDTRARLVARAAGCPKVLLATLAAWAAAGALGHGAHGLALRGPEPPLGEDLAAALRAPLAGVPDPHGALGALAVLEPPVDPGQWRALCPGATDELLARLEATGAVTTGAEGVSFASGAVRAAVLAGLDPATRERWYAAAHATAAGRSPLERGRYALGAGRADEAREPLYRAALARLVAGDVRGASLVAGELSAALGGVPDGDPRRACEAVIAAQIALLQGRSSVAVDEASRAAATADDPALVARALQLGAAATQRAGDLRGALGLLERARAACEEVGDASRAVECLVSAEEIHTMLGDEPAADAAIALALARLPDAQDTAAGLTHARHGWRLVTRGDPDAALLALDRADARFERTGQALLSAVVATYRAAAHRARGDRAAARRELERARARFDEAGSNDSDVAHLSLLLLECDDDRPEAVFADADRLARRFARLGRRPHEVAARALSLWARARHGEVEGLAEGFEALAAQLAATGLGNADVRTTLDRLATAAEARQPALAARVREVLR